MPSRALATIAAIALATSQVACSDDDDGDHDCDTVLNLASLSSPSTGIVTGTGEFPDDEIVTAEYTVSGEPSSRIGIATATGITFQSLPSGSLALDFTVSCPLADGPESYGSRTVVVQ